MSDIIINGDHCALILSKEEAMLIFALVGKMTYISVGGAASIYDTLLDSEFISRDEFYAWWDKHELRARIDLECKAGAPTPPGSFVLVKK